MLSFSMSDTPNRPPIAEDEIRAAPKDHLISGLLHAEDPDADRLRYRLADAGAPRHGTVLISPDGSYTYIPEPYYTGEDRFDYVVSDGRGGLSTGTVLLHLDGPGPAKPRVVAEDVVGPAGQPLPLNIIAAKKDQLTFIIAGVPSGWTLSVGLDCGSGIWRIDGGAADALVLTPTPEAIGTFHLSVSATTRGAKGTATIVQKMQVILHPVEEPLVILGG
jgi:hypothetical protein